MALKRNRQNHRKAQAIMIHRIRITVDYISDDEVGQRVFQKVVPEKAVADFDAWIEDQLDLDLEIAAHEERKAY